MTQSAQRERNRSIDFTEDLKSNQDKAISILEKSTNIQDPLEKHTKLTQLQKELLHQISPSKSCQ